jgi:signal peptidase I
MRLTAIRFPQADMPDYLRAAIAYSIKFFSTIAANVRGDNLLLINNNRYLSSSFYATTCMTLSVTLLKLYFPDDPIKTFDIPSNMAYFSPILNFVPLPWLSLLGIYLAIISLPMYVLSMLLGYKPRIWRIYRASIYFTMTYSLFLALALILKYTMFSLFSYHHLISTLLYWLIMGLGAYQIYNLSRWLGIAHGMSGWSYLGYNAATFVTMVIVILLAQILFGSTVSDKFDRIDKLTRFPIRLFNIPSGSMWPALPVGTELVVNQMIPESQLRVGDIVVFDNDGTPWIKRIVAVGGDKVKLNHGRVFVNDRMLERDEVPDRAGLDHFEKPIRAPCYIERNKQSKCEICHIDGDDGTFSNTKEYVVPEGFLFLMGDNRDNSADSRLSVDQGGIGFVPIDKVIGKAYFVLYPRQMGYLYKGSQQ